MSGKIYATITHRRTKIVSYLVCQSHMGDSWWYMFSIIQQCYNACIQRLEGSTIVTVLLANSTRILQIASPSETQGAHLKVTIGKHVGQTEGIVIFLCNKINKICIIIIIIQ